MDTEIFSEADVWTFPEVIINLPEEETAFNEAGEPQQTFTKQELMEMEHQKELAFHQQENLSLRDEIEALKNNHQSQVEVLNRLIVKLKTPMSIIDEEIVELMQDIIKKLTRRIVCKEISAEPQLILQMVNELRTIMGAKNGLVAIHISPADQASMAILASEHDDITRLDDSLNTGDILLKSNFGEVRALLSERIEDLMRVEHD